MRNKSFATLGTLALLTAASAFGQHRLWADIPFEFSLANKVMPAGHYDVTQKPDIVMVSCYTCGAAALSLANNLGTASSGNSDARLVFNKYGDKYFLAEVWTSPTDEYGAGLIKSKTEREIARANPTVARIVVPLRTGVVTLASLK
jgi:hypothetical protein